VRLVSVAVVCALLPACTTTSQQVFGGFAVTGAGLTTWTTTLAITCDPQTTRCDAAPAAIIFGSVTGLVTVLWAVATAKHWDPLR
jgi:hypothetical protein